MKSTDKLFQQEATAEDKDFFQDVFTLSIALQVQKRVKNINLQELYGFLETYMSAIVMYEYIKSKPKLIDALGDAHFKKIKYWRNRFLKQNVKEKSRKISKITSSMGTDFGHYCFDTIITKNTVNDELIGINFGTWDLATISEEDLALFNSLLETADVVFKSNVTEAALSQFAYRVEKKLELKKYTFASGVMFKDNKLQKGDKYLIMFYYTFFKCLYHAESLIPEAELHFGGFTISTKKTLAKMRASLIAHFDENIEDLKTPFAQCIQEATPDRSLNNELYDLNRLLRNNLHYTRTDTIEETQWGHLARFQKDYFEAVLLAFDDKLKVKTGLRYKAILWFALHTDSDFRRDFYGEE